MIQIDNRRNTNNITYLNPYYYNQTLTYIGNDRKFITGRGFAVHYLKSKVNVKFKNLFYDLYKKAE